MKKKHLFLLSIIASSCITGAFAATPMDLKHQPLSILNKFTSTLAPNANNLTPVSRSVDFNKTTHVRLKQMYTGVPVWGGDVVMHIPKGGNTEASSLLTNKNASMNGMVYQDLNKDLGPIPSLDSDAVLNHLVTNYKKENRTFSSITNGSADLIVYVDADNKAHWAYLATFMVQPQSGMPAKPTYIINAATFDIYQQWDNIQTAKDALGGGFGGNPKMGKLVFDGLSSNLPKMNITREEENQTCFLKNSDVTVKDRRNLDKVSNFSCSKTDPKHDNVWWAGDFDTVNDGYSPGNDALYAGRVIQDMYMKWYGVPALTKDGKPMMLNMRVHENMENAYWDGEQMTFGDGGFTFYPLVSLGVGAHEISHGFTEQHSGLVYRGQSGGMNEAFSDMAAQAAEYYSTGKNSWQIGPEIFKSDGALRYMDKPSKDCRGRTPGNWCSIDKASEYNGNLDVHYSSGIFNRLFYLMGTSDGWNTKKAFDVMVQAQNYWTPNTSWAEAACGVLTATKDLGYDKEVVKKALTTVEVDFSKC